MRFIRSRNIRSININPSTRTNKHDIKVVLRINQEKEKQTLMKCVLRLARKFTQT